MAGWTAGAGSRIYRCAWIRAPDLCWIALEPRERRAKAHKLDERIDRATGLPFADRRSMSCYKSFSQSFQNLWTAILPTCTTSQTFSISSFVFSFSFPGRLLSPVSVPCRLSSPPCTRSLAGADTHALRHGQPASRGPCVLRSSAEQL
jgi:hypothetical protein